MSANQPAFAWRTEWKWIVLPMAIALGVRLAAVRHIDAYLHADSAVGAMMAEDIGQGRRLPIFYYGQAYVGSLELLWAAPWQAAFPGDPRATGTALAVLFVLGLPALYRLAFLMGGRFGAMLACCWLALGTPWTVMLTSGRQFSYLTTLLFGAMLLMLGQRLPSGSLVTRCGWAALAGVAWWNNPQVAQFLVPVLCSWWATGSWARARHRGELLARLGSSGLAIAQTSAVSIAATILASLALAAIGPLDHPFGLPLSFGRPGRYLLRSGMALAALLIILELVLAADRKRWLRDAAGMTLAFALGALPALLARLSDTDGGAGAPLALDPARMLTNGAKLLYEGQAVILGHPGHRGSLAPAIAQLLTPLGWTVLALAITAWIALLWQHRSVLVAWCRLRPQPLPLELQLQVAGWLLLALYLMMQQTANRYLLNLWLPALGLAAWAGGALARRARPAYYVVAIVLTLGYGLGMAGWLKGLPASRLHHLRPLIAHLEHTGAHHGHASYFTAYPLIFLSQRRIQVACWTHERTPWIAAEVARAQHPFVLFHDHPPASGHAYVNQQDELPRRHYIANTQPQQRWRIGPYIVYR